MALLNILVYPDHRLRQKAEPVKQFDDELRHLVTDMAQTMYAAPGIGLAAIQVNVPLRVLVLDLSEEKSDLRVFINPEIVDQDGSEEIEEGCLSVPGVFATIGRADWVKVKAQDIDGKEFEMEAQGLMAVCIQHEIDHLDGKVFVDYLSRLKRDRIRKKLVKEAKERQQEPAAA